PWFQEAVRRDPDSIGVLSDCEECMQTTTRIDRQARACGFEPPAPRNVHVAPWGPPAGRVGYDFGKPTEQKPRGLRAPETCVGYTTNLPEVIEIAIARLHWSKGQLAEFCGGQPDENLMTLIAMLDSEYNAMDLWRATPSKDGGG